MKEICLAAGVHWHQKHLKLAKNLGVDYLVLLIHHRYRVSNLQLLKGKYKDFLYLYFYNLRQYEDLGSLDGNKARLNDEQKSYSNNYHREKDSSKLGFDLVE